MTNGPWWAWVIAVFIQQCSTSHGDFSVKDGDKIIHCKTQLSQFDRGGYDYFDCDDGKVHAVLD